MKVIATTPERTFSEWIAERMRERGLSQSALSRGIGIRQTAVSRWMTSGSIPSTETCAALAHYLGEPLVDVLRVAGHLPPDTVQAAEASDLPKWVRLIPALAPEDAAFVERFVRLAANRAS